MSVSGRRRSAPKAASSRMGTGGVRCSSSPHRRAAGPTSRTAACSMPCEDWILQQVLGFVDDDCNGAQDVLATGCSFGAYHSANLVLRHAERFPAAICMSGVYSIAGIGWGDRGDAVYFNNPV